MARGSSNIRRQLLQPPLSAASAYDAAVLADTPALYLASSTASDKSGNAHTITLHGAPGSTYLPNNDTAFTFDSSGSQYVETPDDNAYSLPTTGALTIECWMAPAVLDQPHNISTGYVNFLNKCDFVSSNQYEWQLRMFNQSSTDGGNPPLSVCGYLFSIGGGTGDGFDYTGGLAVNRWEHFAIAYKNNPSGYIKIYHNGVLVNTDPTISVTPANGAAPVRVGAGEDLTNSFQGAIGKVAIYPTELTSTRILAHFTAMGYSPAPTLTPTSASVTAATAAITAAASLAPTAAAKSQTTASITAAALLTPTSSSVTASAAAITAASRLAPTAASVTASTAAITAAAQLNATGSSVSASAASITAAAMLSPASSSVSAATAAITAPALLTPTAATVSAATATVTATGGATLTPSSTSISATTASITAASRLAPSAASISAAATLVTAPTQLTSGGAATLAVTSLGSGNGNAASITTPSLTPAPNSLLVLWVGHAVVGGTTITVTGLGLTWTQAKTVSASASTKLDCWTATCGASPGTGAITITPGATASICWDVDQVTGENTTTPLVAANTKSASGSAATASAITYNALTGANNLLLYGNVVNAFETQNPASGWTELTDRSQASPSISLETQVSPLATTPAGSTTFTTSGNWGAIGIELAAAVAGVTTAAASAATATITAAAPAIRQLGQGLIVTVAYHPRPTALNHARQLGLPTTLGRDLQPLAITHNRQLGLPRLPISAPSLTHARGISTPTVGPLTLAPIGLNRTAIVSGSLYPSTSLYPSASLYGGGGGGPTRTLGATTLTTAAILRPTALDHNHTLGNPTTHGRATITPLALTHTRAQGRPTLPISAPSLTHTRAQGSPSVNIRTLAPLALNRA